MQGASGSNPSTTEIRCLQSRDQRVGIQCQFQLPSEFEAVLVAHKRPSRKNQASKKSQPVLTRCQFGCLLLVSFILSVFSLCPLVFLPVEWDQWSPLPPEGLYGERCHVERFLFRACMSCLGHFPLCAAGTISLRLLRVSVSLTSPGDQLRLVTSSPKSLALLSILSRLHPLPLGLLDVPRASSLTGTCDLRPGVSGSLPGGTLLPLWRHTLLN